MTVVSDKGVFSYILIIFTILPMVMPAQSSEVKSAASEFDTQNLAAKSVDMWHRGSAWILGPLLIGLVAVVLATASDYANN